MGKKNITLTFTDDVLNDLQYIVDYFQNYSISAVTKSDVLRFLIKRYKSVIENNAQEDFLKIKNDLY